VAVDPYAGSFKYRSYRPSLRNDGHAEWIFVTRRTAGSGLDRYQHFGSSHQKVPGIRAKLPDTEVIGTKSRGLADCNSLFGGTPVGAENGTRGHTRLPDRERLSRGHTGHSVVSCVSSFFNLWLVLWDRVGFSPFLVFFESGFAGFVFGESGVFPIVELIAVRAENVEAVFLKRLPAEFHTDRQRVIASAGFDRDLCSVIQIEFDLGLAAIGKLPSAET